MATKMQHYYRKRKHVVGESLISLVSLSLEVLLVSVADRGKCKRCVRD